jgi:uncharacterized repeat protein (TIGR03837 family)
MNSRHWDIFCTVIDNLGDIGTCWRLAQILHHDHGQSVRLFVDDLDALRPLVPAAQNMAQQALHGIQVHHWTSDFPDMPPAQVVIETFGCTLPESYLRAMRRPAQPVWINLEYMSCEDWVSDVHGQTSLLANGLCKHFIIPSLLPHSGGLLREKNLLRQRDNFLSSPAQQKAWCAAWHIPLPQKDDLKISLFAYENPKLGALLTSLSQAPQSVTVYLPASRLLNSLREHLHNPALAAGDCYQQGSLSLHILPFLPQAEYDHLLWLCDINFVRGEESLTRAIWAGKPFIWQIYPTNDQAHHSKLKAFLDVYTEHSPADHLMQLCAWMQHWNGILQNATDAYTFLNNLHQQHAWYDTRSAALAQVPDLSQNLLNIVAFSASTG